MKHYKLISLRGITVLFLLLGLCRETKAQYSHARLTYKIYRANENNFTVSSTLLMGENDALLIDAQFSKADAHRVVADIFESGKKLKGIYISHGDPDFYFGLPVIKEAFPNAKIYATAPTVEYIKRTFESKLQFWGPVLGKNGFDFVIVPRVLEGNLLSLERKNIIIKGLKGSNADRTYLWIPSIRTIVGGINLFDNSHLWMADDGTKEERKGWLDTVKEMKALYPRIAIPTHGQENKNRLNGEAIDFTIDYLEKYERAVDESKNSQELIDAMLREFPNAEGRGLPLELGAKVAKGEIIWEN